MSIQSINNLGQPQPTTVDSAKATLGRDDFMKLLVTQLKNQDPLDPMDARETVTQLAQLSSVEQLASIRDRIGALEVASAGMVNSQASDLVGRTVTAETARIELGATGSGQSAFTLDGRAARVTATIRNAAGETVRAVELGGLFPGTHTITWDGQTDTGERAPEGRYTVEYRAASATGTPITTSTQLTGRVVGVDYSKGYPELDLGGAQVLLGDVVSISD